MHPTGVGTYLEGGLALPLGLTGEPDLFENKLTLGALLFHEKGCTKCTLANLALKLIAVGSHSACK